MFCFRFKIHFCADIVRKRILSNISRCIDWLNNSGTKYLWGVRTSYVIHNVSPHEEFGGIICSALSTLFCYYITAVTLEEILTLSHVCKEPCEVHWYKNCDTVRFEQFQPLSILTQDYYKKMTWWHMQKKSSFLTYNQTTETSYNYRYTIL